ncbi:glutamate dehydrogenase [Novosphingobium marinum]|uniref:Glutamate dehydrogenase n=1 Tax=Novosphingobium marinum TaxID=1514948 RepID=A0A7Z0BT34_9SPHN|nr:NAD-glutamate dehydrogenase domain-containing protein [Novosphingobium marinum]NYH95541.1 glutamate dehydrogenase [Novosphingobium marinum]GGC27879.1 glutamate dehydrogenase [Novosphingobium marinum]
MTTLQAEPEATGLAARIAESLRESLLPGEPGFDRMELDEAARFLVDAASRRRRGEPSIAIESVTGPIGKRLTRIAVVNDDMPFIVDSLAAALDAQGIKIDRMVHPMVRAERDSDGWLRSLPPRGSDQGQRESLVYIEANRVDARSRVKLRAGIEATLADVRGAVTDWPEMQKAMIADAEKLEAAGGGDAEGGALLRWLNDGMLTQLGRVERHRDGSQTGALGICREGATELLADRSFERAFEWFDEGKGFAPLTVKANRLSRVHRRVPLDLFIVPVVEHGRTVSLSVHAGIWTSAALAAPPVEVPRMRTQMANIMARLDFEPSGHTGKAFVHVLTRLPHDVLIGFDEAQMERIATTMVSLTDRPRPQVALVSAPLKRHLFAFVWLPRDAVSTALRLQIEAMLQNAADAPALDWALEVDGNLALYRMVLDIRDGAEPSDEAPLSAQLEAMVRGWPEAVERELARSETPTRAAAIAARYAEAFPLNYRTVYGPAEAAADIERLRRLPSSEGPTSYRNARLHCLDGCATGRLRLKLYQKSGSLPLSDAVPMLENFGFRVAGEVPTMLETGDLGAIHDFLLELPVGLDSEALLSRSHPIENALSAVLNGEAEDDPFNRLIIAVGLQAHEANWLRAIYRYLRQTGITYGIATAVDALQNAPKVTRGLIGLFRSRHDPHFDGERLDAEAQASVAIREGLADVTAINDDRLLRQYRSIVEATLRTNAFMQPGVTSGDVALGFKIDSALVPGLPKPVPWREIFVYSRRVEGIHLRAGPVARGGLRWSDRRDDFRTEILGLMKAQRVKNAVIVPTGAKGGFYPKLLPDPGLDREAWAAEGKASYKIFIRSLLSLTDNLVGGEVVHPSPMVIRDGDDPYFVVAADKGTASFSDTANAIADEHDFWLDDAFASGGSKGYDHKAMGITARGAWVSVQRHFLERGVDVQTDTVRVAGCGDMSGDVFGNGMLLSKSIQVVAAFDHRHIFIDPDPDPARSWDERSRLFQLPRSSWDDYDKALISKGGGVFPRSMKRIALSPEIRAALGVEFEEADPDTLISAILKAPVDLLWFGGIGTYIKAASENNVEVGDPANDTLRVDAEDVRARVVGEGANLGVTQAGRIEFAIRGGAINTDFIDNSAGVDCSDNEVNIKIALADAKRSGALTEAGRVELLGEMTEEVARLVLEDNRLQALALSIAETGRSDTLPSFLRLIETLEEQGSLDRKTEGLDDSETLARRATEGGGLTRPELAVLLSSAKLSLQAAIEDSPLPDDPCLEEDLVAAFPSAMQDRFETEIHHHQLRREIIATKLANEMINRMGLIHPFELFEEEGAAPSHLGAAFVAAERLFEMPSVWRAIETAQMPEKARLLLFDRAAAGLRPHIADLLRAGAGSIQPSELIENLEAGIAELRGIVANALSSQAREHTEVLCAQLVEAGAPEAEAKLVCELYDLDGAVGLSGLSSECGMPATVLAEAFVEVGHRLSLDWTQGMAMRMAPTDPWERLLVGGLARDFQQMRLDFLRRIAGCDGQPVDEVVAWAEAQAPAVEQFRAMVDRARGAVAVTPAMLAQLASQARSLLAR